MKAATLVIIDGNLKEGTKKSKVIGERKGKLKNIVQKSIEDEIKIALKTFELLKSNS